MTISVAILYAVLVGLSFLVAPVTLIWGWIRWSCQPKLWTVASTLALAGFVLATASVLLAVASSSIAHIHIFRYYDPVLMNIYRCGFLLSLSGFGLALGGVWRRSSLRWFAPACALGTLAFWIMVAAAE
jgi:hypothetical protein